MPPLPEPSNPYFPFHALGYRCNPFRVLTDEEWAEVGILPPGVETALEGGCPHLQILGEAGRGKSTALIALETRLRRGGLRLAREYLPAGQDRFLTDLQGLDAFLLDEAQRLTARERGRLLSAAGQGVRLLLATHEDLEPLFRARGLPLTGVRLEEGGEALFRAALQRRLDYFALPGVPRALLTDDAWRRLRREFGTDLRAAERFLYEVFQHLRSPQPITEAVMERVGTADGRR